jgi:hypothetical protein
MKTLAALALLLIAGDGVARADGESTRSVMETYFAGEKRGGLVLVGMGAAGLGAGAVLITRDSDVAVGASYPALALGAAHLAAGVFVYVASARRIDKLNAAIDRDPDAFAAAERERMRGVRTQFLILKIVEGVLIAGGTGAAIYGFARDSDTLAGVGLGVAAEAAATLVFDIVADRRASRYLESLGAVQVAPVAGGLGARWALVF